MAEAIDKINDYLAGTSLQNYGGNSLLRDAVERNMERLSEASRHIPEALRAQHPDIDWRRLADLGNILRHAYDGVDDDIMWTIVTGHLPPLRAAVAEILSEIGAEDEP